jgi:hypothetical protein
MFFSTKSYPLHYKSKKRTPDRTGHQETLGNNYIQHPVLLRLDSKQNIISTAKDKDELTLNLF